MLTALLVTLAVLTGLENVTAGPGADLAHPLDSQSPLIIPVFVAAFAPVLWRPRAVLAAIGVSFVVTAASVPMFGWVTRCGWGRPLAFALPHALARLKGDRQEHVGLAGIFALQVVTLVKDSFTGGLSALVLSVPVAAAAYGLGLLLQSHATKAPDDHTLAVESVHA